MRGSRERRSAGKHVLPRPLARRAWILARERERQPDLAEAVREIELVLLAHRCEVRAQRPHDATRQHRHAILESLAVADQDLAAREIDVLHAQPHALHDPHPGAVEEPAEQPVHAAQAREHRGHLLAREHDRQLASACARARRARSHGRSRSSTSR